MQSISLFLFCCYVILAKHSTWASVIAADSKKVPSAYSSLAVKFRRTRREPAVWGEPAPDYSNVVLDGITRYMRALLFVDRRILGYYGNDMSAVRNEVIKTVKEANDYFYQVDIRVTVIDILQIYGSDLSLYSFEGYRYKRLKELPAHDFAVLLSYRYGGGLAFVGGMCTTKAVMLCGYYPHNPEAMGSIFFHEVAHLIGVPHRNTSDSIRIANCSCDTSQPSLPFRGCLKIPGFDHDCTLQEMVNTVKLKSCIKEQQTRDANINPLIAKTSISICGNGIVEEGEECDCGLIKFCQKWNCRPQNCTAIIKTWHLYLCLTSAVLLVTFFLLLCIGPRCLRYYENSNKFSNSAEKLLAILKSMKKLCYKPCYWQTKNKFRSTIGKLREKQLYAVKTSKIDKHSIVTLVGSHTVTTTLSRRSSCRSARNSLPRPSIPPPPPPINAIRKSESSGSPECKKSNSRSLMENRPPIPSKPTHLRKNSSMMLLNDFLLTPKHEPHLERLSLNISEYDSSNDERDEIMAKFADFDDEFDSREKIYVFKQPCFSTDLNQQITDRSQFTEHVSYTAGVTQNPDSLVTTFRMPVPLG